MSYVRTPGLVSVVVTSHNFESYLTDCLDSIVRQTYPSVQIILVDDHSTDGTRAKLETWMSTKDEAFSRNKFVLAKLPRRVGYAGAMTIGLFLARGEFIAIQDADDLSHPERIERQVRFLQDHLEVGVLGTNYAMFDDGDFDNKVEADWLEYGRNLMDSILFLGGLRMCLSTVVFRGVVFDREGGLSRHTSGSEDQQFLAKCINEQCPADNLRDVLYYARNHSRQRSKMISNAKPPEFI